MKSEKIHSELNIAIEDLYLINSKQTEATDELIQLIKQNVFGLSKELFIASKLENYYWEFSSFSVFESHYSKRLDEYLIENDNEEFSESDFINKEIDLFNSLQEKWYLDLFEKETLSQIQKAFLKKRNFLNDKIILRNEGIQDNNLFDLSDTTGAEKIVYLYELGIIDFLKNQEPFKSTPDKVSQVISAFTGIKLSSLRPAIRLIIKKDFEDKNNPMNTQKTVKKVKNKLIDIGFEIKKIK